MMIKSNLDVPIIDNNMYLNNIVSLLTRIVILSRKIGEKDILKMKILKLMEKEKHVYLRLLGLYRFSNPSKLNIYRGLESDIISFRLIIWQNIFIQCWLILFKRYFCWIWQAHLKIFCAISQELVLENPIVAREGICLHQQDRTILTLPN